MPVKIVGCLLILAAGACAAVILRREATARLCQLEGFIALLRYIRACISSYNTPMDRILASCDADILAKCGARGSHSDIDSLMKSLSPKPEGEIASVLASFASEIGRGFREEQLRGLDYHISRLESLRAGTVEATEKKKRLVTALCLSGAAATAILLI